MAAWLLYLIGVIAGVAVLCAVIWAVCRCCCRRDGAKKEGGGGGAVSSAAGKHEGLLNKSKDAVAIAVPQPEGGGGFQQGGPPEEQGDGEGEAEVCAICKARLAEEGWGGCRRLRPCGHAYHAVCIGLWLQRRWVCPVCRASVAVSPTEIMEAMV
ncbi:unnamed protein product [Urochloa decumbens]|uniref:RING-type E3 ubiquitin transferase n=1 Tax=Urochloa decumbens TaxID=240449 RepID=A0ABC8Z1B3_9POAL